MQGDEALQRAFQSLRDEDERRTVSFDAILHRNRRVERYAWGPLLGASVASAVLVALAVTQLELPHRPQLRARNAQAPFILAWRSPTDFLLDTPGSELMRNSPEIGSSIDSVSPKPTAPNSPNKSPSLSVPEQPS
jgi:hypothetical protein